MAQRCEIRLTFHMCWSHSETRPVLQSGVGVSEVTSGLTVGFQGYDGGLILNRVHCHDNFR